MTAQQTENPDQDRGYAWVIGIISFVANILLYGLTWTVGVFHAEFVEIFPESSGTVALISSLNTALFYLAGPLSSFLVHKYGHRSVAIAGGLVGSLGLVLSSFANSVYMLYVTFGITTGFGLGIAYIPCGAIISSYFVEYRTVALGISASGIGLGTCIYPPLIRALINNYGWQGAVLILGAITLNVCVCGALLRPIECTRYMECIVVNSKDNMHAGKNGYITQDNTVENEKHYFADCKVKSSKHNVKDCVEKEAKYMTGQEYLLHTDNTPDECEHGYIQIKANKSNLDISLNGTNHHVFKENHQLVVKEPKTLCASNLSHLNKSLELSYEHGNDNKNKDMLNLIIFKNVNYLLLGLNQICANFGLSVIYVHLAAYTRNIAKVSDDSSAVLFIIIGGVWFVGRNIWGFVGHIPRVATTAIYTIGISLAGILTIVCPVYDTYNWLLGYAAVFGFMMSCYGVTLEVIVEVTDVQYLTSGLGYILIFEAFGTLFGAPVAGWLYEWTGNYKNSMYLGGSMILFSGIIMLYPMYCVCRTKLKQ